MPTSRTIARCATRTTGAGRRRWAAISILAAPDLRLARTQQLTDGELFYVIENGVRLTGMPAWGDGSQESKRATWHLVTFIRHLPELTRAERLEMERVNPKSPEEWRKMQKDEEFLEGKEPSRQRHKPGAWRP